MVRCAILQLEKARNEEANASDVNKETTLKNIDEQWEGWYIKGLSDFIRVPNLTPMVDKEFLTNGLIEQAMKCVDEYINKLEL